ncbi:phage baseplate assembly protein V [Mesorhizobium yinganensis]|uniref:phage baseplate assembly protein V n=1 Tax=Mesorhizobium yinganensis TaxID=3157707 RepID=UPI0032B7A143
MIEDLVQRLIDRLDHHYLGKYRGYVSAVEDPEGRGRIRAVVPRLLGEREQTGWAEPASPYAGPDQGFFTVPDLGAGVWIEFEEGDLSKPIWAGCWWGAPTKEEVEHADSATRRLTPMTEAAEQSGARVPETPQHYTPRESPTPKVRVFKSATGHHIVLDDREGSERIEIHDSRGNRLILSEEGLDQIVINDRTYNKGNRTHDIDGRDVLEVAKDQEEKVGEGHVREVGGDVDLTVKGSWSEEISNGGYKFTYGTDGFRETVRGDVTQTIQGGETKTVVGAASHTYTGGLKMNVGTGSIGLMSSGPFQVNAAMADTSLSALSLSAGVGNVSINSMLGVMQLGGISAYSPMVLGDGLMIHFTVLSQLLKAVYPPLAPIYGPAIDTWAAMTPALDLSYFGFVKRFPVG